MLRQGWWKGIVIAALLGVYAISAVGAQGAAYNDPQGRFSFTVPNGWQAGSPPQGTTLPAGTTLSGIFAAPAPLNANFNVVTVSVPAGTNLDQVVTASRTNVAQSVPGYQEGPGGIQSLTLGGQPARRYDYFLTPPQATKLHGAQVIAIQANTAYVLTFTAAENDFDAFFQQGASALNSFKLIGGTGGATTALPATGQPRVMQWQRAPELLVAMFGSALIAAGVSLRRRYRLA